jgi:hypothetical protein
MARQPAPIRSAEGTKTLDGRTAPNSGNTGEAPTTAVALQYDGAIEGRCSFLKERTKELFPVQTRERPHA